MRRSLLIASVFLITQWAGAQVDRMDQPSLGSYYNAHLLASDSTWWFVGQGEVSNSFNSQALLRGVDGNGALLHERYFNVPGYELASFTDIAELPDGSLILSGMASYGCDFGPFEIFIVRYSPDTLYWQRVIRVWPNPGLDVDDSTIYVWGSSFDTSENTVIGLNLEGDSLRSTQVDVSWSNGMCDVQQGALVYGHEGMQRITPDGSLGAQLSGPTVAEALELSSGGFVILTPDSLLMLDSALQYTGVGTAYDVGYDERLLESDGHILVVGNDSVIRFGSDLSLISTLPLEHPEGYFPATAAMDQDLLMTSGTFRCGVSGAAFRGIPLTTPGALPIDVAFRDLAVDSSNVHQVWGQNGTYITGQFWVSGWLVNEGDLRLDSVMINQVLSFGICTYAGYQYAQRDLALLPGDSVMVVTGPFGWFSNGMPESAPTSREFCLWASCPDNRLDRDVSNNEACVELYVPVGIEEFDTTPPPAVFPNPASDQLSVDLSKYAASHWDLAWLDISGRVIERIGPTRGGGLVKLNLSSLAHGIYLLEIRNDILRWTVRVAKM